MNNTTKIVVRGHSRRINKIRSVMVKKHSRKKKIKKFKRGQPKIIHLTKIWKTTYLQNPTTGLMMGRKHVDGAGDKTGLRVDKETYRIFGRLPKPGNKKKKKINLSSFTTLGPISDSLTKSEEEIKRKKSLRANLSIPKTNEDLNEFTKRQQDLAALDIQIDNEEKALKFARGRLK